MDQQENCLICSKHAGVSHLPPGGMIYEGRHFSVCHAPPEIASLGTLFIEANRHIIDYAEMTADELAAFGVLIGIVYRELKAAAGAERVYQVTMVDGVPHFHTWLVSRRPEDEKGMKFLNQDFHCDPADAKLLTAKLRQAIGNSITEINS